MATNNIIKKSALTPTVLIAGGAGFIGSNLAETLLLQNARVVVLDNFSSGKDNYITPLLQNPKFALFNADINKGIPEEIESVDYIFHLASIEPHMSDSNEVSLNSLLTNSLGTKVLLDFANKCKAKLLLVSSTNIYQGMMSSLNLDRYFGSTNQDERKYSHAEAKRYAEALVGEYYKRYNTDVRIVRVPEIYGPKMELNTGAPIGMFLKDLLDDKDLTLYGEGTDKEYYLYVTDAVAGIIKALFNEHTEGKIYSLVDKEHFTTLELAYLLKSLAQREIQIIFKNKSRIIDHPRINPDISNLGELKWDTKVNLKDGLKMTLKWFGYETNEHSFKPAILIENKKQEQQQTEAITGLISSPTSEVKETLHDIKESFLKFGHKVDSIVHEVADLRPNHNKPQNTEQPKAKVDLGEYKNKDKKQLLSSTKSRVIAAIITFVLIAAFVFLALPSIQTYSYVKSAYSDLDQVPNKVTQLDSEGAADYSNKAYKKIDRAQNSFSRLKWVFTVLRKGDSYSTYNSLLSSAKYFSRATYYGAKAVKPFEEIVHVIRPDSEEVLNSSQIKESQLYLANAKSELQLATADFKKTDINKIPNAQKDLVRKYEMALLTAVEGIELAEGLATDLPNLIGLDSPKKYLILFQNSNEIRATGGFIGSYAVLEINKGKIASLTIDDIYNPDGQIDVRDIKVTAPEPITTLLEEDRLYIRNANWDPNLATSATQIQDLFFKIDGSTFNGVIAIDLFFAKNLLNVTGPLFLTAYNEEISAENLYERTQFHSEFNYEEGSSQKKSFLTVLGSKLLEKLFSLEREKMPLLAQELNKSLEERHLSLSLNNSSFNTILENKKWDGNLVKPEGDYLFVVNSNLGGTKANYFVENKMNYTVSSLTRDGLLRAKLTLDYKHTGDSYAWPGGPYTNYVRIYTKTGTKLTGATLSKNGEAVEIIETGPLTKEEAEKLRVEETVKINPLEDNEELSEPLEQGNIFKDVVITEQDGYTIYEIPFTLLPKEELTLVIEYDLPKDIALGKDNKTYELYWQKQPGTEGDEISYRFNYPLGLMLKMTLPEMKTNEGTVYLSDYLNKDKKYRVALN